MPPTEDKAAYDARLQHMDDKFGDVNKRMDGFDERFTGIESSIATMGAEFKASSASSSKDMVELKSDIRYLVSKTEANRREDEANRKSEANQPSTVRTGTIVQVLSLVLGSSGFVSLFLYMQLTPLRDTDASIVKALEAGLTKVDHESANRHSEQQTWVIDNQTRVAILEELGKKQMEMHGAIARDIQLLWKQSDATAQALTTHQAQEGHPALEAKVEALRNTVERMDKDGSIGALKLFLQAQEQPTTPRTLP